MMKRHDKLLNIQEANLRLEDRFLFEQVKNTEQDKTDLSKIIISAGYSNNSPEYRIAMIIGTQEGWRPGTRSFRNNNPGNLAGIDFKDIDPNVKLEPGKKVYAQFSSPVLGVKALVEKKIKRWASGKMPITSGNQQMILQNKGGEKYISGQQPTIAQFFYTYAPPNENDTESYINNFVKGIGGGISRNTKLIDILN